MQSEAMLRLDNVLISFFDYHHPVMKEWRNVQYEAKKTNEELERLRAESQ